MSDTDLKILNDRKEHILSKITWYKDKVVELEGELECINSYISSFK